MKKVFICTIFFLFFSTSVISAQSVSQKAASRRTAERCMKLSENYLLAGDVNSSLYQAELGITYDDSISDLFYLKATCKKMQGASKKEVLEIAQTAKDKNNWIGYNEKGNRILLADLLSDTGNYNAALGELDRTPFVFSADAEAIRIKTYYREGSKDSLSKARDKINSARRIYKGDSRFISLFFNFELSFCLSNGKDFVPEGKVLQMADVLSEEMKNYQELPRGVESAALFFMGFYDKEKQLRGLKAYEAEGNKEGKDKNENIIDYFFPVTALSSGYWDEEKSFREFFTIAEKSCTLEVLEYFISLFSVSETEVTDVTRQLYETLNSWNGLLYVDINKDFQWELEVQYERGRPQSLVYDGENDGVTDISASLDFGELLSVNMIPLGTELFYSNYPEIGKAHVVDEKGPVVFDFAKRAVSYSPIKFENYFDSLYSVFESENDCFYVPFVKNNWDDASNLDYLANATFIKLNSPERENGSVTYSLLDGYVVSALYEVQDKVYATADFVNGLPSDRYVDYDNDGLYETHEIFEKFEILEMSDDSNDSDESDESDESKKIITDRRKFFSEQDFNTVRNMFPFFDFSESVFLSTVLIDRNNDNNPEYREFFREKGGKTSIWIKEDGRTESFTRYPHEDGYPLIEESVFVVGIEQDTVSVIMLDGEPSSVKINEISYKVSKGEYENIFWIGEETSGSAEIIAARKFQQSFQNEENGFLYPFECESGFFSAVKIAEKIFVRKMEISEIE